MIITAKQQQKLEENKTNNSKIMPDVAYFHQNEKLSSHIVFYVKDGCDVYLCIPFMAHIQKK